MTQNIQKTNYNKLNKLTGGLLRFISSPNGYIKIQHSGYMDLIIERIGPSEISLTHYFSLCGDLVADPDMQIRIDFDNESVEALTFQNCICYQSVYSENGTANEKLKKELNKFLNFWLTNLCNQGFYKC